MSLIALALITGHAIIAISYQVIEIIGVIAYLLMFVCILSGLLRWKLKYHKIIAVCALTAGFWHALSIFLNS
jgi:hypothetical protein